MLRTDKVRIRHIFDAAKETIGFTEGCSRPELDTDRKLALSLAAGFIVSALRNPPI